MTRCSRCSAENRADAKFCAVCGGRVEPPVVEAAAPPAAPRFAPMRGMAASEAPAAEVHYGSMRGMAEAPPPAPEETHTAIRGTAVAAAVPARTGAGSGRNPKVATVLSIVFPSAGQFYNGDTKKGLVMLAILCVGAFFNLVVGAVVVGMVISLGVWVWSFLDAGKVARGQGAAW